MEFFYICVILAGIFIVCFALTWMAVEKKKSRDYRLDIDEKKYELQQVIADAEQLLTELNNFSGYIVDRLEEKQKSLEELLGIIEEKTGAVGTFENIKTANDRNEDVKKAESVGILKGAGEEDEYQDEKVYVNVLSDKKGKLISLDERKREVIKLYKKGISSTEIARMLNMGKGEIELISRMCK